jgi:NAD(P)-dependent dehydrogenase (short-subunit alcohol dehydrogenase family)
VTALRAIVTGASSGIGLATAKRVHDAGGSVALLSTRAGVLSDIVAGFGERAAAFPTDVSDAKAVDASVQAAVDALGGVDLVVNSAGVFFGPASSLDDMSVANWDRTIGVNLSGVFYVSRAAALRMERGSIVNVGSELSLVGMGLYVDYCASKAGLIGLTRAMAAELAPRGIRVNAVCPGPVDTPMMDAELEGFPDPQAAREGAIDRVPLKRFARPEEIADAILFLASAEFATGSIVSVDGGTTAI